MALYGQLVIPALLPSLLLGMRLPEPDDRRAYERQLVNALFESIFSLTSDERDQGKPVGLTQQNAGSINDVIAYKKLPRCKFDSTDPVFPPWVGEQADWHDAFLIQLHNANVTTVLTFGSLLGAYRHHGTIPFDEDMDMIFSVCENMHLVRQSDSRFKNMSCQEIKQAKEETTDREFENELWENVLSPVLSAHNIIMVDHTEGGIRLSNGGNAWNGLPGGIGVDFLITVPRLTGRNKSAHFCKCKFGQTFGYCHTDSKRILAQQYGATKFMVPKSQCDYYSDIGHANWAWRSKDECEWAKNAIAMKEGTSQLVNAAAEEKNNHDAEPLDDH
eukprot:TRINITY_DN20300_c0_g3_i1.p1 TRINITY_DN20300_c0_g3~~TRINITY_DN20300_c0_g3_i1.p1  ORF type:complete len:351 (+),score=39.68 TRINITY_DN20300_c0_g3_i1:62-1054(+)